MLGVVQTRPWGTKDYIPGYCGCPDPCCMASLAQALSESHGSCLQSFMTSHSSILWLYPLLGTYCILALG